MAIKLQMLPEHLSGITYGVGGITAAAIIVIARLSRRPNLDAFPAVGCNGLLGSWRAGYKYLENVIDVIQEGYEKHKSVPFKVADPFGWIVILTNREHLEELRMAPDDQLSLQEAASDKLNTRYTLGDEIHDTPMYHFGVIRSQLTRNIDTMYPDIRDEIVTAFEEVLDLADQEWKSVSALDTMQKVICRSINRLLVGLPLCRDPDWIDLNNQYAVNILKVGLTIGTFPEFMKPVIAPLFTAVHRDTMRCQKHLGPIIEERLKQWKERGDGRAEMPNDLISWLIEDADDSQLTVKSLATRVLAVNFPAIETTSIGFTLALFYLAENPQYIEPLREEVEGIVAREGWTKTALGKMRKVDSFLRECQRVGGGNTLSVIRKAMKDFTFSDGTLIPKGTIVGVPTRCLHLDEKFYKNAHSFEPFRFAEIQGQDEDNVGGHNFISTSIEYQPFGHGKHACPGRLLAATIMKTMLARLVTAYDIKLEDGMTDPRSLRFGTWILPNPSATVLCRRRTD